MNYEMREKKGSRSSWIVCSMGDKSNCKSKVIANFSSNFDKILHFITAFIFFCSSIPLNEQVSEV